MSESLPHTAAEAARLASLADYEVLDSAPEEAFDRLTQLAAQLFGVPMAVVSLVDAERQWFKSRVGVDGTETPRELAFCAHAIQQDPGSVMVVEDATRDVRFAENPLVTGAPDIRFYAGAVLSTADGANLGTLCVIDNKARPTPSSEELERLRILARIVVDELELRRAKRRAERKQRLLEMAEHMAGIGHWRFEVATGRIEWSDELYAIHGVTREVFDPALGVALAFYNPEDQAKLEAMMDHAIATGGGYEFETVLYGADGAVRDVACRATCEFGDTGKVVALVGVFQDISARKAQAQALKTSEARYRLLADNASDVIMHTDLNGRISYVSPSVSAAIGYTAEETIGRRALDLVDRADLPAVRATVDAQYNSQGDAAPRKVEYRTIHKDGREIWLEARPALAFDAETGAMCGFTDVVRDITDRKMLEQELRDARAQAEAATAVKSEFLANMSHELRTPLTSIIGFTGLVSAQPDLSETTERFVGRIADAGRALLATVNDVLDFSKLEAGEVVVSPEPVDPTALCRATLDLFTPQAAAKDLTLDFDCALPPGLTLGLDPDRVRQVLLNLVGNAVKFCPSGRVGLKLAYDDGLLRVEVADSGPGLDSEQQAKLFQRFSQVDGSLTRKSGGTGLGLAICKGLIEAMGGRIGIVSELGVGSTFWFEIPAAKAASAPSALAGVLAAGALPFPGVRILLADDHAPNRELARLYLAGVGAEVTEARDGREAVTMAEAQPFDLILMDMRMPHLNGREACAEIRNGGGPNEAIPILAFTAMADEAGSDLIGDGFDGIVGKPLDATALIGTIRQALDFTTEEEELRHVG